MMYTEWTDYKDEIIKTIERLYAGNQYLREALVEMKEMKEINVYSQKDLDEIERDFSGRINICEGDWCSPIIVRGAWANSAVVACGDSTVVARGNSSVEAWGNSTVEACDNSAVEAWGNSTVVAKGNSHVVAKGNSHVDAWDNSSVVACDNSSVKAWENSSVVAWANSSVKAWENSYVVAYGDSTVVARGNSSVEAWGNSTVDLNGYAQVRICSDDVNYTTSGYARVILPFDGIDSYINYFSIKEKSKDKIILYKAVRKDDYGVLTSYWDSEFKYEIGKTAHQANIDTDTDEACGVGLHVSTADFVLRNYANRECSVIIECEVPKDKTVVYRFSDGKIRTSELRVLREVPLEELGVYDKIVAKKRKKGGAK